MRSRYKAITNDSIYFITSSIVKWNPLFNHDDYKNILIQCLKYIIDNHILRLHAFVIIPNHFHAILSTNSISKTVKEFKSYTARLIIKGLISENNNDLLNKLKYYKKAYKTESLYQIWQEGYHPEMIFGHEMFCQKAEYIHNNPLRAKLVEKAEDWKYSSASNYILGNGILPIEKIL